MPGRSAGIGKCAARIEVAIAIRERRYSAAEHAEQPRSHWMPGKIIVIKVSNVRCRDTTGGKKLPACIHLGAAIICQGIDGSVGSFHVA